MEKPIRWVANLSLLFTELPLLERPAAAMAAGFDEMECWWPFGAQARPRQSDVDAFVRAVEVSGIALTAMNLFGGDPASRSRGILSYPECSADFRDSVDVAMGIARRLGVKLFNAPYGDRRAGLSHPEQDSLAVENLTYAANAAGDGRGVIMVEPLSGDGAYPVKTSAEAVAILDRAAGAAGATNLGLLFDVFHLTRNGADVGADIALFAHRVVHVQLADAVPGRGEPGSGTADLAGAVSGILATGYEGAFALEYIPSTTTEESLRAWWSELDSWGLG